MKSWSIPHITIYIYSALLLLSLPSILQAAPVSLQDKSIKEFAKIADMKQKQAQENAKLKMKESRAKIKKAQDCVVIINRYFNEGKAYYRSKKYTEARNCFEQILVIEPSYEPAKLYLECLVIQEGIFEARDRIEIIMLKMTDILAEYDRRVKRMDSLAVKYFLEEAQKECQLGNFTAAESRYNLCYKIYPYSKDKIEWFVTATYDLIDLYKQLDEENMEMERLASSLN